MMINRKYMIEEICDKHGVSSIEHPYFDGKKVIATNGNMLAIVPVGDVEEDDTPGYLPKEDLKLDRKNFPRNQSSLYVRANGLFESKLAGISMERPSGCEFPKYEAVIPAADRKEVKIVFDLELLIRLFKALGGEAATTKAVELGVPVDEEGRLTPPQEGVAFRVRVKDLEGETLGLLMAMRGL